MSSLTDCHTHSKIVRRMASRIKSTLVVLSLSLLLFCNPAWSVNIQAYYNVGVVKMPVTDKQSFWFTSNQFGYMVDGMIGIEGTSQYILLVSTRMSNVVNDTVAYKDNCRSSSSNSPCRLLHGILVDPERGIVKSKDTGRYMYVPNSDLEFIRIPDNMRAKVDVYLNNRQDLIATRLKLYYLTKAITWEAEHVLTLPSDDQAGEQASLQTFALLKNHNDVDMLLKTVELFATDLKLPRTYPQYRYESGAMMAMGGGAMGAAQPSVPSIETLSVLRYQLPGQDLEIKANGFSKFPLLSQSLVSVNMRYRDVYLNEGSSEGNLQKIIRILPMRDVPAGRVLIVSIGGIVAVTSVPQLPAQEIHDLFLGDDPVLKYTEQIVFVDLSKDRTRKSVRIQYVLKNTHKTLTIPVEMLLRVGIGMIESATINNPAVKLDKQLKQVKVILVMPPLKESNFLITITVVHIPERPSTPIQF